MLAILVNDIMFSHENTVVCFPAGTQVKVFGDKAVWDQYSFDISIDDYNFSSQVLTN